MPRPVFGADYYPEQWKRDIWESDARRMKEMGLAEIRLMEFAWILLEPEEGTYDFSLFDEVIDLFASYGIKTILGTPTATFPEWLYRKDPDLVQVHPDGTKKSFGIRRQGCFNSSTYFDASMKIALACARHFGENPNVIGWQVDNEIGHEGSEICVCGNCQKAFHEWLRERYGSVETMNETWGTVFWGTSYSDFDMVPLPLKQVQSIQNPGLILDFYRFSSESAREFMHSQFDILRQNVRENQWITHNVYNPNLSNIIDMEEIFRPMNFAGYNNYPVWGEMDEPLPYYYTSCMLSYARGLKDRETFSIFEQICGFQGHTCLGYRPSPGQVVQWTNQAVAHGAERLIYFRWRTAPYGQEQLCYGLLDPDNEETDRMKLLGHNIRENADTLERIIGSDMEVPACVVYDRENARVLKDQYLSKGIYYAATDYLQLGYDLEVARHYAPMVLFNVTSDVKTPSSIDLSKYSLVSLPLYQMADPAFVSRLDEWVRRGGTLILGWRSGARDEKNHSVREVLPGPFAEMAGIRIRTFESLNETKVKIRVGLFPAKGEAWADVLEPVTARSLAVYTDKKKFYRGKAAVTVNRHGRGRVFYLGTSPDPLAIFFLYRKIFKEAGLKAKFYGEGLEIIHRRDESGKKFQVALNHTGKAKRMGLRRIGPWEMKILK